MEDILAPEVIHKHVPGVGAVLEGAAELRAMHEEIGTLGRFQKTAGFTSDRSQQRVAKLNAAMLATLDQLHEAGCTCSRSLWGVDGHRAWFYSWLESDAGRAFDVRGKVAF